jgi:hypothetical protein
VSWSSQGSGGAGQGEGTAATASATSSAVTTPGTTTVQPAPRPSPESTGSPRAPGASQNVSMRADTSAPRIFLIRSYRHLYVGTNGPVGGF